MGFSTSFNREDRLIGPIRLDHGHRLSWDSATGRVWVILYTSSMCHFFEHLVGILHSSPALSFSIPLPVLSGQSKVGNRDPPTLAIDRGRELYRLLCGA